MHFSKDNHYVPIWYQKKFLCVEKKQIYIQDLVPKKVKTPKQAPHKKWQLKAPKSCFFEEHLYTTYFNDDALDQIETVLFGRIDNDGAKAFPVITAIDGLLNNDPDRNINWFISFINAQIARTPRSLRIYQKKMRKFFKDNEQVVPEKNQFQNFLINCMCTMMNTYRAIWCESVWEIVSAESSSIKFIISDNPVTLYNPDVFPRSSDIEDFRFFGIHYLGTRTIIPLSPDYCLILSNREYLKNPGKKYRKERTNARILSGALFNICNIIRGRQLDAEQVSQLNCIIKENADRYVAAANPTWLEPEKTSKIRFYPKFDPVLLPTAKDVEKQLSIQSMYLGRRDKIVAQDVYGRPISPEKAKADYRNIKEIIKAYEENKKGPN